MLEAPHNLIVGAMCKQGKHASVFVLIVVSKEVRKMNLAMCTCNKYSRNRFTSGVFAPPLRGAV